MALGAVVTGSVTVWRERVITDRERAAQQADREQRRKDVRDAFQRESLLALQDAIEDARKATVNEWQRQHALWKKTHEWEAEVGDGQYEAWHEHDLRVRKLSARVLDPRLRLLLEEFGDASHSTIRASMVTEANSYRRETIKTAQQVHERISALLPELF